MQCFLKTHKDLRNTQKMLSLLKKPSCLHTHETKLTVDRKVSEKIQVIQKIQNQVYIKKLTERNQTKVLYKDAKVAEPSWLQKQGSQKTQLFQTRLNQVSMQIKALENSIFPKYAKPSFNKDAKDAESS